MYDPLARVVRPGVALRTIPIFLLAVTLATAQNFPSSSTTLPGCGLSPAPVLQVEPPVLGGSATITLTSPFPRAAGFVFYRPAPVRPQVLGAGCHVYLDDPGTTDTVLFAGFVTDDQGDWIGEYPVPASPGLAGLQLVFQAQLTNTHQPGPLVGDWPSNGVLVTVGTARGTTHPALSAPFHSDGASTHPELAMIAPAIGQTSLISLSSSLARATGWLDGSYLPVTPSLLPGTDRFVHLDILEPDNLYLFANFVTDVNGNWSTAYFVPDDPAIDGLQAVAQARLYSPVEGSTLDPSLLSNGLLLSVGAYRP